MKTATNTPTAIQHRADKAERIGSALAGIAAVLIENETRQYCEGDGPFLDAMTTGNLHEALLALSDQLTDLAADINRLGGASHD